MTFILGLNLCDKVYIGADTRITKASGTTEDHVCKILPILLPNQEEKAAVAVAGCVRFASFLHKKIQKAISDGELSGGMNGLKLGVKDFIGLATHEWITQEGTEYAYAVILFGGISPFDVKTVAFQKIEELAKIYEKSQKTSRLTEEQLNEHMQKNEQLKLVSEKMYRESGRTMFEQLRASSKPAIPLAMKNAIRNKCNAVYPATYLFSVIVDAKAGTIRRENSEWGERLGYGSRNITTKDVPHELVALCEFGNFKKNTQENLMESALMQATIKDTAEKLKIESIGGTVLLNKVDLSGIQVSRNSNDIILSDNKPFYKTPAGTLVPLVSFTDYAPGAQISAAL